ncbi:hypothetical protein GVAV_002332 [Gurleya vavrai]
MFLILINICIKLVQTKIKPNFFELLDIIDKECEILDQRLFKLKKQKPVNYLELEEIIVSEFSDQMLKYELEFVSYKFKSIILYTIRYNLILKRLKKRIIKDNFLQNEGSIISLFENKNIIKVKFMYNYILNNYVIKWTVFECLDIFLPKSKYQDDHITKICYDLLNALDSLYKSSYAHLDLKHSNVLACYVDFKKYNSDYTEHFIRYIYDSFENSQIASDNKWRKKFETYYKSQITNYKQKKILNAQNSILKQKNKFYLNSDFYLHHISEFLNDIKKKQFNIYMQIIYSNENGTIKKELLIYVISNLNYFIWGHEFYGMHIDPFLFLHVFQEFIITSKLNTSKINCKNIKSLISNTNNCLKYKIANFSLYFHQNCKNDDKSKDILFAKTIFVIKNFTNNEKKFFKDVYNALTYKLIDFDLARKYSSKGTNSVIENHGTLPMIPPEIYFNKNYNLLTDLWNLGYLALLLINPDYNCKISKEKRGDLIRTEIFPIELKKNNGLSRFILVCLRNNPSKRLFPEKLMKIFFKYKSLK